MNAAARLIVGRRPMASRLCRTFSEAANSTTSSDDTSAPSNGPPPPIPWMTDRMSAESIEKVDRLFHKILWLDIFETHMLIQVMNERMGVKLSKKQERIIEKRLHALDADDSETGTSEGTEEKKETKATVFDVKLNGFDKKSKLKVIKQVRSLLGLGLKEAKELVESAPVAIGKQMSEEKAQELEKQLAEVGGEMELVQV